eukprot:CAMPEP_0168334814 /NCGR_PEP_ID=MMETSP0213-20121227/10520_1 /TAXON_ID=151035 /ORGANISM="Euplotes harpa, Strain FSP1.4" /LENGTH=96 /DNA_ID=CAMNT_0008339587 /DNA_START=1765 /DNA_END=2055 /DNA_ORIENTATION=-
MGSLRYLLEVSYVVAVTKSGTDVHRGSADDEHVEISAGLSFCDNKLSFGYVDSAHGLKQQHVVVLIDVSLGEEFDPLENGNNLLELLHVPLLRGQV